MLPVPGRKDVKAEFHVMSLALSKELEMMEAQLNRWKETAHEANSLRGEAQSLKVLLGEKVPFHFCWILLPPHPSFMTKLDGQRTFCHIFPLLVSSSTYKENTERGKPLQDENFKRNFVKRRKGSEDLTKSSLTLDKGKQEWFLWEFYWSWIPQMLYMLHDTKTNQPPNTQLPIQTSPSPATEHQKERQKVCIFSLFLAGNRWAYSSSLFQKLFLELLKQEQTALINSPICVELLLIFITFIKNTMYTVSWLTMVILPDKSSLNAPLSWFLMHPHPVPFHPLVIW